VVAQVDTGFTDSQGQFFFYKLNAVDIHGNESPYASLVPPEVSGVGDGAGGLSLYSPVPNPARFATTISFSLPSSASVSLVVCDARGRKVRTLQQSRLGIGPHVVNFDLRDEGGRRLSSGVYLVMMEVDGKRLIRRLTTIQ
jgi:flagellar hook capping protein FlgD